MADDLRAILPETRTVLLAGEDVVVRPYGFGQFPDVIDALGPLLGELTDAIAAGGAARVSVTRLVSENFRQALKLCEMAVPGRDAAWWAALPSDQGIALLSAILELNIDFFARRLRPAAMNLWGSLAGQMRTMGLSLDATPSATGSRSSTS